MNVDTAAALAVLTLPVWVTVVMVRALARHNYLRAALVVERRRREWARAAYREERANYRAACASYRRARRAALAARWAK